MKIARSQRLNRRVTFFNNTASRTRVYVKYLAHGLFVHLKLRVCIVSSASHGLYTIYYTYIHVIKCGYYSTRVYYTTK